MRTLILTVAAAVCLHAATVFTTESSFVAQTGPNTVATFEDVAAGTGTPVISAGATFSAANPSAIVMDNLVALPHSFWFGSAGSSPNFFGTLTDYNVSLPSSENAFGVLMTCFGCDPPNDSRISWTLFSGPSGTGSVVDSGSQIIDLSLSGTVRFLGVISSATFQSIAITKIDVGSGFGGGTYVIDDFRFATAAASVPEPSYALPIMLALAGLQAFRKRVSDRKKVSRV
jgi:hypothetical protein